MRLLVITGLPGTGKTTLARMLAQRYDVPIIGKDLIKEPLLDVLGSGDRAWSRRLSDASFAVLFAVTRGLMESRLDAVLEGNFRPGEHETALRELDSSVRLAQVLCRVEETERRARLSSRKVDPTRHPGHGDLDPQVAADRTADEFLEIPGERFEFQSDNATPATLARLINMVDGWWRKSP